MRPSSLYILIVFLAIPVLAFLAYSQFQAAFSAKNYAGAAQTDFPKFDDAVNNLQAGKNAELLDYTDPYGKLKIRYGSSWIKTNENAIKTAGNIINPDSEELMLLLYKVDLASFQPSYLVIERLNSNSWDEILGTMQKDAEENEQTMEIVKTSLDNGRVSLEIKYGPKDKNNAKAIQFARQREEIFIDGDKSYVLAIATTEQNWPLIRQEAEEIFGFADFTGGSFENAAEEIASQPESGE